MSNLPTEERVCMGLFPAFPSPMEKEIVKSGAGYSPAVRR